jgi:hypothetical protein
MKSPRPATDWHSHPSGCGGGQHWDAERWTRQRRPTAEATTEARLRTGQMDAAIRLLAIFALAVLAACSSTSSPLPIAIPSHTVDPGRLTGTFEDWVQAVCDYTADRRGLLPSATSGGQCVPFNGQGTGPFAFGIYPPGSEWAINQDLAMLGPYAAGSTGTESVVFAAFMDGNRTELMPLEKFGFVIHPGKMSSCSAPSGVRVECPARGAPATASQPSTPRALPAPPSRSSPSPAQVPRNNPDNYLHWRFQSKTANIACDLDGSSGEGVAVCEVREHAYKRAVKPDCAQGWVNSFSLRQGRTVVVNCYADTIFQGALLVQDYGYPLTVGSITCVIDETTGVTCKDATTGHYFQAARQSYRGR